MDSFAYNSIKNTLLLTMGLIAFGLSTALYAAQKFSDPLAKQLGYQSRYISANGLNFHYVEKGPGHHADKRNNNVILFLHGYPFFWYAWHNLMERLFTTHRVIALDNRGYNLTDKPDEPEQYHLRHLVADVVAQIGQLAPGKKVTLVGHDWGGTLAWAVAQKHPELLQKLVVINAPPYNVLLDMLQTHPLQKKSSAYMEILKSGKVEQLFAQNGPAMLWNYGFNKRHESGEMTDFDKQAYFNAWQQHGAMTGALNWYRANIPAVANITEQHYWPHKNAKVLVPSLLIWTEGEKVFVPEIKTETALIVPNLSVVTLAGSGHAPFLDKPDDVTTVIQAFFDGDKSTLENFNAEQVKQAELTP